MSPDRATRSRPTFWIESVDRAAYDRTAHAIVLDVTVDFESVYLNDPVEWRTDTWDLYRSWPRSVWASFVEGAEADDGAGDLLGAIDWPTFTPALVLNGNAGRLTASCPGELIYRISQRQATQAEFEAECSFAP